MSSRSEVNNPYGPDAQFDLDSVRHAAFIFFDQPEAVVTPLRADRDLAWFRVDAKQKPSAMIVLANEGLRSIDERLVREFELLRNTSCGSVVHPLGINHDRGRVALFLEWPGDRNLAQVVQERSETSTDLRSVLSVACEIAYSVLQVHDCNLIHGDIKPLNCFLTASGKVKLTGFGLAGQLVRDERGARPMEAIAGTLAYMAPEQTGRINRSPDARSDLYSLGVSLFELFTGRLPFSADDALEWAHRHVASEPPRPSDIKAGLPSQLDAIVLKLMAKDPDERYQTAKSVENDLRRCLAEWTATQDLERFAPARSDAIGPALSSAALYGRRDAIKTLLNVVDRMVKTGKSEFVLVSGPSGVGKSALIGETFHILAGRGILLAAGKFDQHKRGIPYATFAQAFGSLVRQVLSKGEAELGLWRTALADALHPNSQQLIDLIPELVHVIGQQPVPATSSLATARVRFHLAFREFLKVFATEEHPLVLFIDDLQWLDAATLDLLQSIVADSDLRHLLIIGAARDDDLDGIRPIQKMLGIANQNGGRVSKITLRDLRARDVAEFIENILSCSRERAAPLAELISEKTAGNPFFTGQFVRELVSDGSLFYDPKTSQWMWNISRIRTKSMTDNVAQLLATRIDRLPGETRNALGLLSLLGNAADEETAALAVGLSAQSFRATLQPAIDAGLVAVTDDRISFVHDQIQATAYASVRDHERSSAHLKIARMMLERTPAESLEGAIFDIISQIERGLGAVQPSEAAEVAALFLTAGRKAKAASAFSSAATYFEKGISLLGDERWTNHHELVFQLEVNLAECEVVIGRHNLAEKRLEALLIKANNFSDKAQAVCLTVFQSFTTGRSDRAVEIGSALLRGALADWPETATWADVQREYDEMHRRLRTAPIASLIDLPCATDPFITSIMSVMNELFPAAYAVDRHLMEMILLRMTNLSMEYGHSESSTVAYPALNMALGVQFGDYATAYAFGELARQLVDRNHSSRFRARVYSLFTGFATPWIKPFSYSAPLMAEAFRISCSTGDLAFAAYNTRNRLTHEFMAGLPLRHIQSQAEEAVAFATNVELGVPAERFFGQLQLVQKLRGTGGSTSTDFDGWALQEQDSPPGVAMMVCYHWVFQVIQHYLSEDFAAALAAVVRVDPIRWAMRSSIEEAEYEFYSGLTSAALADLDGISRRNDHLDALRRSHRRVNTWAENCSENFGCREVILGAELARLDGDGGKAGQLYEHAIGLANSDGTVQLEAIAAELAGRFYSEKGMQIAAQAYLRRAKECYVRWGCAAKVQLLDYRYYHLRDQRPAPSPGTIEMPIANLDVEAIGRASKVLSTEMVVGRLVEKLIRLAVQHAGAERGALLLLKRNELFVEAAASTKNGDLKTSLDSYLMSPSELPSSVFHYVLRSKAPIVLNDVSPTALNVTDEYLQRARPRSLLCIPIFNAAEVIGLLYVENRLAHDVFSADRIAVLDFLASQAGICLANGRLYSDLQRSEAWLREAQRLTRSGSFFWQNDADMLECSDEIHSICGFDGGPVTPERLRDRVHPADRRLFDDLRETDQSVSGEIDCELRLQMDDGTIKVARLVARARRAPERKGRRLCSLQDITEIQATQAALGKVRSELAHVSRTATLGVLTASITHEMSQPLLAIAANAETSEFMLSADPPDLEGARRMARRCQRDGKRAGETLKRVRSLFGDKARTIEPIDINDVLREVLALARNELQMNDVTVQTTFCRSLPAASGDRVQIQQVVLNLLLNALEAMKQTPATERNVVLTSGLGPDGTIQVDVRDNGTGIQLGMNEKLFEAFYTTKEQGMGVGLSVSRAIIESLGGILWASPNVDAGATFSFTLRQHREAGGQLH